MAEPDPGRAHAVLGESLDRKTQARRDALVRDWEATQTDPADRVEDADPQDLVAFLLRMTVRHDGHGPVRRPDGLHEPGPWTTATARSFLVEVDVRRRRADYREVRRDPRLRARLSWADTHVHRPARKVAPPMLADQARTVLRHILSPTDHGLEDAVLVREAGHTRFAVRLVDLDWADLRPHGLPADDPAAVLWERRGRPQAGPVVPTVRTRQGLAARLRARLPDPGSRLRLPIPPDVAGAAAARALAPTDRDLVDAATLALVWRCGARAVSAHRLRWHDLTPHPRPDGDVVYLTAWITGKGGVREHKVFERDPDPDLCPVGHLLALRDRLTSTLGHDPLGTRQHVWCDPARTVTLPDGTTGHPALSAATFGDLVARTATRSGANQHTPLTGHSVRAGRITTLYRDGHDDDHVAHAVGHRTLAVQRRYARADTPAGVLPLALPAAPRTARTAAPAHATTTRTYDGQARP